MIKILLPILLLVLAGIVFFYLIDPVWNGPLVLAEAPAPTTGGIKALTGYRDQLNQSLADAQALDAKASDLLSQYNSFSQNDLARLEKFLPSAVDNVQLIIDVNNIATRHSMIVKNVKVTTDQEAAQANQVGRGQNLGQSVGTNLPAGVHAVLISFSVSGNYQKLQDFLSDLSRSLRLVELDGLSFTSTDKDQFQYDLQLKTFWFKY